MLKMRFNFIHFFQMYISPPVLLTLWRWCEECVMSPQFLLTHRLLHSMLHVFGLHISRQCSSRLRDERNEPVWQRSLWTTNVRSDFFPRVTHDCHWCDLCAPPSIRQCQLKNKENRKLPTIECHIRTHRGLLRGRVNSFMTSMSLCKCFP